MVTKNISAVKSQLSALLEAVQNGGNVIIAKSGKPIARIVKYEGSAQPRTPGSMAGEIQIAPDFDVLPDDMAKAFGMLD